MYKETKPGTNAAAAAEWSIDHVLMRIGAKGLNFPRFKHDPTEQANKDLILLFMKDLENFFTDYYTASKLIERNTLLSAAGIQEQLQPLQRKFNERLNADTCKRIRTLQEIHLQKVARLYEMPADTVAGDPVILEMRGREVRDYLRTLQVPERIKLLFTSSDPFLIHCFETAPVCIELIPAAILEHGRLNRIMRKRGADLIPLQDERLALQQIVGVFNNIPVTFNWLSIIPGFLPMSESVLPAEKELDPVIGDGEDAELMRLVAEMTTQASAA